MPPKKSGTRVLKYRKGDFMKINMKKSITMETVKKIVSIAIILAMMAGLSACSGIKDRFISDKEKDRIKVYEC